MMGTKERALTALDTGIWHRPSWTLVTGTVKLWALFL